MDIHFRYAILAIFLISLISLIGIVTLGIQTEKLQKMLMYFIAFSAGTLMGDAFLHLLPETIEEYGFQTST
jgi:zinc and cadmium transporter